MAASMSSKHPKRYKVRLRASGPAEEARYLIVRLPGSHLTTILVLMMTLACVFVSFPGLRSVRGRSVNDDPADSEIVPVLFNDLANERLLKAGYKALFITDSDDGITSLISSPLRDDIEMDMIHVMDLERQNSIREGSFDLVFASGYESAAAFIDRALKKDGVLAVQLSRDSSEMFEVPTNYRIVYFRKFESPVLAMTRLGGKRIGEDDGSAGKRRLMAAEEEEKKAVLQNLEDVLLEPPRAASRRSSRYLKKTRYLPDLMGDKLALERYPRRVFIDVGSGSTEWFERNYPKRNLDFEMYTVETVGEEVDRELDVGQGQAEAAEEGHKGGMSEWLKANVREEEYVVMKAEAEVVEEMVMGRAIRLVDELFLECKPRGRSRRAYWECLALYGRLRDEGVAVHQWWG